MRPIPSIRRSIVPTIVWGSILVFVGGLALAAVLVAVGVIDVPFWKAKPAQAAPPDYTGMVPVPVASRPISKYSQVTREYILDPKAGGFKVLYLRQQDVTPAMLIRPQQILGRVLNHDKPVGYVFTEQDFFPKGTRPGLVGAIPPGKRALDIEVEKIAGIQALRAGDHFDLVSSMTLDNKNKMGRSPLLVPIGLPPQTMKKVAVEFLVQDGIVISAVTTRKIETGPPSARTGIAPSKVVHEVVIAVGPDEVDGVMESLALKAEITCFARSGRPDDPASAASAKGLVAVPMLARAVACYGKLTQDDFINPRTKKTQVVMLRDEDIGPSIEVRLERMIGRVTSREQAAGHVFTKDDFLPEGTRPGLVGGIPAGKRAVEIDAAKIKGIYSLKAGDHFDLIGTLPLEKQNASKNVSVATGGLVSENRQRVAVDVLVHYGVVVAPVTSKFLQTGSPFSGTADASTKTIQEVVIAIDPKEAALLSAALALKAEITCVARSGHPDDPGADSVTPGIKRPKVNAIEVISGGKREVIYVFPEPADAVVPEARRTIKTASKDGR